MRCDCGRRRFENGTDQLTKEGEEGFFDFAVARTNCWSEENARDHFAQNDNGVAGQAESKASGHSTEIVGMT
jgi:hypothetical protein